MTNEKPQTKMTSKAISRQFCEYLKGPRFKDYIDPMDAGMAGELLRVSLRPLRGTEVGEINSRLDRITRELSAANYLARKYHQRWADRQETWEDSYVPYASSARSALGKTASETSVRHRALADHQEELQPLARQVRMAEEVRDFLAEIRESLRRRWEALRQISDNLREDSRVERGATL